MKTKTRVALYCWLVVGLAGICATAQEAVFFRLVSTQQIHIVSLDSGGLLIWSNAIPGAPHQVQAKRGTDGAWTNGVPTSPVRTNGSLSQVRVPMCRVVERWIVAFQPDVTLAQAEALFEANEIIWDPRLWDWLKMVTIVVPKGASLSAVRNSPYVSYVEPDAVLYAY